MINIDYIRSPAEKLRANSLQCNACGFYIELKARYADPVRIKFIPDPRHSPNPPEINIELCGLCREQLHKLLA